MCAMAAVVMDVPFIKMDLAREVCHNPGGLLAVLSNRENCLARADGSLAERLQVEVGILRQMHREKRVNATAIGKSKPRF